MNMKFNLFHKTDFGFVLGYVDRPKSKDIGFLGLEIDSEYVIVYVLFITIMVKKNG